MKYRGSINSKTVCTGMCCLGQSGGGFDVFLLVAKLKNNSKVADLSIGKSTAMLVSSWLPNLCAEAQKQSTYMKEPRRTESFY